MKKPLIVTFCGVSLVAMAYLTYTGVITDVIVVTKTPPTTAPLISKIMQNTITKDEQNYDSPRDSLAEHIKQDWIVPPFHGTRQLRNPLKEHYSQRGQSEYIDKLLKKRVGGFFIECGALDGEGLSNSLFFEKSRNWTGLLIEANPLYFKELLKRKRHAYMMNACLSPSNHTEVLDFRLAYSIGGLIDYMDKSHRKRIIDENGEAQPIKIQCFPLLSILKAINVRHVDYFSLDIEGAEYDVLKHFPFDEIQVDVLTVEYVISGNPGATREKLKQITDLMIGRYGYKHASYEGSEDIMLIKGGHKR